MKRILITAGATHNPIDSMRSITANASGKTGVFLANAFGDNVDLLGSPIACLRAGEKIRSQSFGSTRDLMSKMHDWVLENPTGCVIHSAAVGDYEVSNEKVKKIPSGQVLSIKLLPTPKIIDNIKNWSKDIFLVSFKAASPETTNDTLEELSYKQMTRTQSDIVFANVLGRISNGVLLTSPNKRTWYAHRDDALNSLINAIKKEIHVETIH